MRRTREQRGWGEGGRKRKGGLGGDRGVGGRRDEELGGRG